MKKTLLLLCAAFCMAQTMFALTIEADKYYTIKAINDSSPYMADNMADDKMISLVSSPTASAYWTFIPTGTSNCYYIRNFKTGRYIQGYSTVGSDDNPVKVLMGDDPKEYQIEEKFEGRFGFSYTSNTTHDFTSGTWGLNPRANEYVQVWGAVSGSNPRSFWTLTEVDVLANYVFTIKNYADGSLYLKDIEVDNIKTGNLDKACLWQFVAAGGNQYYVKNILTSRYIQECSGDIEKYVKMGENPVAYVIKDCGSKGFGLTSANHNNTGFNSQSCIGLNARSGSNDVQSYYAQAGTNNRSFWKFTEYQPQAIDESGYASYGNTTEDVIILGAQAYKGTAGTSWLSLSEVSDVPANNGVIIKGSLYAVASKTANADMTGNSLLVSDGTVTGDGTSYALSTLNGTAEVGFYPVGNGVTIPAGKAYLSLSGGSVKGFTFVFEDDATSIQTIDNGQQTTDAAIYNLAGQRISKMQKGINIINGKKVLY